MYGWSCIDFVACSFSQCSCIKRLFANNCCMLSLEVNESRDTEPRHSNLNNQLKEAEILCRVEGNCRVSDNSLWVRYYERPFSPYTQSFDR